MSKLTDFYTHRASLQEEGKPIDSKWEQLEDQLLKEELLPELIEHLKTVLSKVQSPLMFSGSYDPNGCISVSFTRNCIQLSTLSPSQTVIQRVQGVTASEEEANTDVANEPETTDDEAVVTAEPRFTKSKSIGFSVSFRDGTVYHEKKAVNTWILALKKIGLETICNNRSKHSAWHRVNGRDICIVERSETLRDSDGKSPQTLVDGFYVMTQLSNGQKEKDLLALGEFLPKLGIKVIWDDEAQVTTKKPVINEEATKWNLPINIQFQFYLSKHLAETTADSYISTIDNAVRQWIKKEVDEHAESIYSYITAEDVRLCIEMLNSSPEYVAENNRKHRSMSAALNQYLKFIEEWEKRFKK
ncbi:MAG: hypothetical protein J5548_08920 [Prevotella sp.]|nr:hypothetical protein [Prevotella sp.]